MTHNNKKKIVEGSDESSESVEVEVDAKSKRWHNKTPVSSIIQSTRGIRSSASGVQWFVGEVNHKKIQFISIDWTVFCDYYRRSQGQNWLKNARIKEKFQPSKCRKNKKDPNSPPLWIEVNRETLESYGISVGGVGGCFKTYEPWWAEVGLAPPQSCKKMQITHKRSRNDDDAGPNKQPRRESSQIRHPQFTQTTYHPSAGPINAPQIIMVNNTPDTFASRSSVEGSHPALPAPLPTVRPVQQQGSASHMKQLSSYGPAGQDCRSGPTIQDSRCAPHGQDSRCAPHGQDSRCAPHGQDSRGAPPQTFSNTFLPESRSSFRNQPQHQSVPARGNQNTTTRSRSQREGSQTSGKAYGSFPNDTYANNVVRSFQISNSPPQTSSPSRDTLHFHNVNPSTPRPYPIYQNRYATTTDPSHLHPPPPTSHTHLNSYPHSSAPTPRPRQHSPTTTHPYPPSSTSAGNTHIHIYQHPPAPNTHRNYSHVSSTGSTYFAQSAAPNGPPSFYVEEYGQSNVGYSYPSEYAVDPSTPQTPQTPLDDDDGEFEKYLMF